MAVMMSMMFMTCQLKVKVNVLSFRGKNFHERNGVFIRSPLTMVRLMLVVVSMSMSVMAMMDQQRVVVLVVTVVMRLMVIAMMLCQERTRVQQVIRLHPHSP
jgi:hypothetical protein